jgi:hypothetical protein
MDPEYWRKRRDDGWRIVAVEWEKVGGSPQIPPLREEIPYGLRIGTDCKHLEEDPAEKEVMVVIMEAIVQDRNLSEAAAELNRRGFTTRTGFPWGPAAVFALLPRLIEVGPRIFSTDEWATRRRALMKAV